MREKEQRRKAIELFARTGFDPNSHSGKGLLDVQAMLAQADQAQVAPEAGVIFLRLHDEHAVPARRVRAIPPNG